MNKNCEIIYKNINIEEKYEETINKVINKCFQTEKLESTQLYISVTLTNDEEIKLINNEHRGIDKSTDVLSFPMFEKAELDMYIKNKMVKNKNILGDIIININQVMKQAKEYGHSFDRELSYMTVHGFYHLCGYDHMKKNEQIIMRQKEEHILNELQMTRKSKLKNTTFIDAWKNAINGIIYATSSQKNIQRQLLISIVVVISSLFFDLTKAEFLIFIFTITLIILAEMMNTAIETVVDLLTELYHPKAKIAKDVAAGGVVIATINAVIVGYFLFFDKISDIGFGAIKNIIASPTHIAFSTIIIVLILILSLVTIAKANKNKVFNEKFIPSGHACLAFAANTIIWIITNEVVIITLSLILALLVALSRLDNKAHKLSEIIISAIIGIGSVYLIYGMVYTLIV